MSAINNVHVSKNFKLREFECHDGSHLVKIHNNLIEILQNIRDYFDKPIIVTSGFRTISYNNKVKNSSKKSQHMKGKAADIIIRGVEVEDIARAAEKFGATGIGCYKKDVPIVVSGKRIIPNADFVHLDVRETKARWGVKF